jgi:aldehyde:ferredoxin oxidoreductase
MYGYHGKALLVNLTSRDVTWEALPEPVLRQFIGGTGLGTYLLYTHGPAGVEPFDPANPLIFVTSPLVGTRLTTSSKFAVLTKSPLTGCIGDALSSSFMATELKQAGCDALVITGRSSHPCLLFLHDGVVEFLDATPYCGLSTAATEHAVRGALGHRTRVACIGPRASASCGTRASPMTAAARRRGPAPGPSWDPRT